VSKKLCVTPEEYQQARVEKYDFGEWNRENHQLAAFGRSLNPKPKTPMLDKLGVGVNINTTCCCGCPCRWEPLIIDDQGSDAGFYVHRKDGSPAGNGCLHGEEE